MQCRRCGILGDAIRLKWWHKLIPLPVRRYYCAGCGGKYLSFFPQRPRDPSPSQIRQEQSPQG